MDYPLGIPGLNPGVSVFSPGALSALPAGPPKEQLRDMINEFGKLSAVAQGLGHPITDFGRCSFSG